MGRGVSRRGRHNFKKQGWGCHPELTSHGILSLAPAASSMVGGSDSPFALPFRRRVLAAPLDVLGGFGWSFFWSAFVAICFPRWGFVEGSTLALPVRRRLLAAPVDVLLVSVTHALAVRFFWPPVLPLAGGSGGWGGRC